MSNFDNMKKREELRVVNPPEDVRAFVEKQALQNERTIPKQIVFMLRQSMKIKSK
jgi:hypothetical protein